MPATEPPADLSTFPTTRLPVGSTAWRIFLAHDPASGQPRSPWFFSSGGGRFDLPAPMGSCYLSDRAQGAWLEVFRGTGLVDRTDVDRRRLVRATRTEPPSEAADLRSARARRYGVTADLVAGDRYDLPQRWAAALHTAGHRALVATARHDPTHRSRTVVLFGGAGPRQRVNGWRTTIGSLGDDHALLRLLMPFSTGVLDRPRDVPVRRPPG